MSVSVRRGDIVVADLEPVRGSEANKRRPVVIVSNGLLHEEIDRFGVGVVTVVPLTSSTERVYRGQVLFSAEQSGLAKDSKAQAELVRAIATGRLMGEVIGHLSRDQMVELDQALRLHLSL